MTEIDIKEQLCTRHFNCNGKKINSLHSMTSTFNPMLPYCTLILSLVQASDSSKKHDVVHCSSYSTYLFLDWIGQGCQGYVKDVNVTACSFATKSTTDKPECHLCTVNPHIHLV
jgi:hypothetical protein